MSKSNVVFRQTQIDPFGTVTGLLALASQFVGLSPLEAISYGVKINVPDLSDCQYDIYVRIIIQDILFYNGGRGLKKKVALKV